MVGDAIFEIDPDIRVARTLPARVSSDPEIFRLQRAGRGAERSQPAQPV